MKLTSACHNHTTFCDGKATPSAMAAAAYMRGFTDFGFSGHSRTRYAEGVNFGVQDEAAYCACRRALRQEYAGRMDIAIGMEQDYYAPVQNRAALDYLIGAVHDFHDAAQNRYYWVDGDVQNLQACKAEMFGGDGLALAKGFYALTAKNALENKPDIIAHFDLIVKNNADGAFFDEESPAYRAAALEALHACMETGAVFELNTGGMSGATWLEVIGNFNDGRHGFAHLTEKLQTNRARHRRHLVQHPARRDDDAVGTFLLHTRNAAEELVRHVLAEPGLTAGGAGHGQHFLAE